MLGFNQQGGEAAVALCVAMYVGDSVGSLHGLHSWTQASSQEERYVSLLADLVNNVNVMMILNVLYLVANALLHCYGLVTFDVIQLLVLLF